MASSDEKKVTRYTAMITGIGENVGANESIPIEGVPTGKTALTGALQVFVDAVGNVATTHAAYRKAVAEKKAAAEPANETYLGVKTYAVANYAKDASKLGSFGLTTTTRKKPTAETLAAAVLKREATRAARGTKGKRQKAKITGETPATAPAAASAGSAAATTTTNKS
jgi:hypothetical protein